MNLALLPLLGLLLTPERMVGTPRLGTPPTHDTDLRSYVVDDGFVVTWRADQVGLAQRLSGDGRPLSDRPLPSRLALSSIAVTDGRQFLAAFSELRCSPPSANVRLELIDETLNHSVAAIALGHDIRSVDLLWTGGEYAVMWTSRAGVLQLKRISREGVPAPRIIELAHEAGHESDAVMLGEEILVATRVRRSCDGGMCETVRLLRVTATGNVIVLGEFQPSNLSRLEMESTGDTALLLLVESIPGTVVTNAYRITRQQGVQHVQSIPFPTDQTFDTSVLALPDSFLLHRSRAAVLEGRRLSDKGEWLEEWRPLLDLRGRGVDADAAWRNGLLLFAWSGPLSGDPLYATLSQLPPETRADGEDDETLLAIAASRRTAPASAAGRSRLNVWKEELEGQMWISGELTSPHGALRELRISPEGVIGEAAVASDGEDFMVVWTVPGNEDGALRARRVEGSDGALGEILHITEAESDTPAIVWSGGNYVVAWEDRENENPGYYLMQGTRIVGLRLDAAGRRLDAEARQLAGPTAFHPALSSDQAGILLVWTDGAACFRTQCRTSAFHDIRGRIFHSDLTPRSDSFVVADDPAANETHPSVASSGNGWMVGWRAWRDEFRFVEGGGAGFLRLADAGHAVLSPDGSVARAHEPSLTDDQSTAAEVKVVWAGGEFVVASIGSRLHLQTFTRAGDLSGEQSLEVKSSELALSGGGGSAALVYTRPAPELYLGGAPQVFERIITSEAPARRRAARR